MPFPVHWNTHHLFIIHDGLTAGGRGGLVVMVRLQIGRRGGCVL